MTAGDAISSRDEPQAQGNNIAEYLATQGRHADLLGKVVTWSRGLALARHDTGGVESFGCLSWTGRLSSLGTENQSAF